MSRRLLASALALILLGWAFVTAAGAQVPGAAPSPGPIKVPDDKLRSMLGLACVTFRQNEQRLAIIDTPIQN